MTVPALRGANLYALLRPIAAGARKRCQARRARLGGAASECANAKDFVALSESCAFEAHRTFVRQLRVPFNWGKHREAVIERTRAMLVIALEGSETNYGEWRMRQPNRRRGITGAQPQAWTAWRRGIAENNDGRALGIGQAHMQPVRRGARDDVRRHGATHGVCETLEPPQETDLDQALDAELIAELERVLTPLQYRVTIEHYLQGKPQRQIARELRL